MHNTSSIFWIILAGYYTAVRKQSSKNLILALTDSNDILRKLWLLNFLLWLLLRFWRNISVLSLYVLFFPKQLRNDNLTQWRAIKHDDGHFKVHRDLEVLECLRLVVADYDEHSLARRGLWSAVATFSAHRNSLGHLHFYHRFLTPFESQLFTLFLANRKEMSVTVSELIVLSVGRIETWILYLCFRTYSN